MTFWQRCRGKPRKFKIQNSEFKNQRDFASGDFGKLSHRSGMENKYVPTAQYPINPTQSRKAAVWGEAGVEHNACRRYVTIIEG